MLKQIGSIATSGPFIADAPMAIAIFMRDAERPDLDAGRAIQQMEIMAWSLGLGTCFVGFREPGVELQVKQMLGVPMDFDLITVLPFGYRLDSVRGRNRKRKAHVCHRPHGPVRVSLPGQIAAHQQLIRSRVYEYGRQRRVPV